MYTTLITCPIFRLKLLSKTLIFILIQQLLISVNYSFDRFERSTNVLVIVYNLLYLIMYLLNNTTCTIYM